mmetsp:Transcript_3153/g.8912  ORF Transcript_3153/g.8912 Transcript_3153/m.8912 type:complete len:234 (-) Transcript_3153:243-944(-)
MLVNHPSVFLITALRISGVDLEHAHDASTVGLKVPFRTTVCDRHLFAKRCGDLVDAPQPIVDLRCGGVDHDHAAGGAHADRRDPAQALDDLTERVESELLLHAGTDVADVTPGLVHAESAEPQASVFGDGLPGESLIAFIDVLGPAVGHHDLRFDRRASVHAQRDAEAGAPRPWLDEILVHVVQVHIALGARRLQPCVGVLACVHELLPLGQSHAPQLRRHNSVALTDLHCLR